MHLQLAMLTSDWLIYSLLFIVIIFVFYMQRVPHWRDPWHRMVKNPVGMVAATILLVYVSIGLMDSIHFEVTYSKEAYTVPQTYSLLDLMLQNFLRNDEKSYSAPFSLYSYGQKSQRLKYGGAHILNDEKKNVDIFHRIFEGVFQGLIILSVFYSLFIWYLAKKNKDNYVPFFRKILQSKTTVCWREILITFALIVLIECVIVNLIMGYHIMGTDKVGHDVFYASIKSIRTGLLIGVLTTIFMLPFALIFGMVAGFFGGWIDDIVQYLYTTLSSIPAVLLISATILVMQVYISRHSELFPTLIQRADARLLVLCMILGLTSWASLCRLLRAETLKIRELEFVQASKALGVRSMRILFRHIMPNVMHIVLITIVLDFSMLVLAEAVLSYVGVGVDPTTFSWGNMINSSRLELAREPMVWWPLGGALLLMFVLVLSANLFADALRDALDPRIRTEIE